MRAAWVTMMLVLLAGPAAAGAFEDGLSAYNRQDYVTAFRMWRILADQGIADAQTLVGLMYDTGRGVPRDYVLAYMWTNLGAAGGDEQGGKNRDLIAARMTPAAIEEAQRLSREWKPISREWKPK